MSDYQVWQARYTAKPPRKTESITIPKETLEHEHYFQAFVNDELLYKTVEDLYGNKKRVTQRVYSVGHFGPNDQSTKFVLEIVKEVVK